MKNLKYYLVLLIPIIGYYFMESIDEKVNLKIEFIFLLMIYQIIVLGTILIKFAF